MQNNNTKNKEKSQGMNNNIKKTVIMALYIAIFVVLSIYGTIRFGDYKLTVQNLPIYLVAISLGAIPGAIVGFTGMLLNQMITYGFQATTLFWVLPQTILGAICGYIFENDYVKVSSTKKFFVTIIALQIVVTFLNTIASVVDALIYGYFNFFIVFGPLIIRLMLSIMTGVILCIIIPIIIKRTKKYIDSMIKS